MPIDRRDFLIGTTLTVAAPLGTTFAANRATLVSACRRPDGSFAIALLSDEGNLVREIPLSARGHDIAVHAGERRAVAFARRPGFFAVGFDIDGRSPPTVFAPRADRHYFGHGAFSRDGRRVFAAEHDIASGAGLIGIYDATGGYRRIGEFASGGIGPHEVILLADGRTLAVANGGIATDLDSGREPIEIDTMRPSLALIDSETGTLLAKHELPREINRLSIRHLAANAAGEVWFGAQWQGGISECPALIGRASRDRPLRLIDAPTAHGIALKGYIGTVAMHRDGRYLAASAPRAGQVVYVDTQTGTLGPVTRLADTCGLATPDRDVFAVSSGHGSVQLEHPGEAPIRAATLDRAFDNHLRFVR